MGLLLSFQQSSYTQSFVASPLVSSFSAIFIVCVATRVITGVRSSIAQNNHDVASKTPNRIPYWLPFIGSALSFLRNIESTITRDRQVCTPNHVHLTD
jgi:hypothetical protein